jgi:hypothetical protein
LPRLDLLGFSPEVQQYWFDQFFEDYSEQMSRFEDSEDLKDIATGGRALLDKLTLETVQHAFRHITLKPQSDKTVFGAAPNSRTLGLDRS